LVLAATLNFLPNKYNTKVKDQAIKEKVLPSLLPMLVQ